MSGIAVPLTRVGACRPAPRIWVALACLASALAYSAMRLPAGASIHASHLRTCAERGLRPDEWLCGTSSVRATVAFVVASLLIGAAVALPCAVLASTGRRATAFVPLLLGLGFQAIELRGGLESRLFGITDAWHLFGNQSTTYWETHTAWAIRR